MAVIRAAPASGSVPGILDRSSRTSSACRQSGLPRPRLCQIPRVSSQRKGAVMPTCPRHIRYRREQRPSPETKRVPKALGEGIQQLTRLSRARTPRLPGLKIRAVQLLLSQMTWQSWKTHPASIAWMALASRGTGIGMRRQALVPPSSQTTITTMVRCLRNSISSTPHTSAPTRSLAWLALSVGVKGSREEQQ